MECIEIWLEVHLRWFRTTWSIIYTWVNKEEWMCRLSWFLKQVGVNCNRSHKPKSSKNEEKCREKKIQSNGKDASEDQTWMIEKTWKTRSYIPIFKIKNYEYETRKKTFLRAIIFFFFFSHQRPQKKRGKKIEKKRFFFIFFRLFPPFEIKRSLFPQKTRVFSRKVRLLALH